MKKGIIIKVTCIILIWEILNLFLYIPFHENGMETGYISLFLLYIMFYILGKSNQLTFQYFKPFPSLKIRLSEVVASYGWVMLIRSLLLIILVIPFLFLESLPTLSGNTVASSTDLKSILISLSLTGILTPIVEEFVFRGVIFDLTKSYSRRKAMLFNVFLFAVLHMNMLTIINSLIIGVALYELREKNNDIISCIMLHILINTLAVLSANNLSVVCMIVDAIAVIYYIYRLIKWKNSANKSENSKKNVCVKY